MVEVHLGLALASRLGMTYVHISLVQSLNVNLLVAQHILNTALGTLCYLCYGYRLSWVKNLFNFSEGWIFNSCTNIKNFLENWRSMLLCEGVVTMLLAGRTHFIADVYVVVVLAIVQPVIKNLITNGTDLNEISQISVSTKDWNDLTTMHILPGSFALTAAILYGKRAWIMDFNPLPANAQPFNLLGYALMALGYIAQCESIIQALMAVSVGMVTTMALNVVFHHKMDYWACVKVLQSSIAAIIGTYHSTNLYQVLIAACSSAMILVLLSKLMLKSNLEDNCSVIVIHGIIGWLSLVTRSFSDEGKHSLDFPRDLALATIVFLVGTVAGLITLLPFKFLSTLRSTEDKELHEISKELEKLQNLQKNSGTFQAGSRTRI